MNKVKQLIFSKELSTFFHTMNDNIMRRHKIKQIAIRKFYKEFGLKVIKWLKKITTNVNHADCTNTSNIRLRVFIIVQSVTIQFKKMLTMIVKSWILMNKILMEREVYLFGLFKLNLEVICMYSEHITPKHRSILMGDIKKWIRPFCTLKWRVITHE